MKTILSKVHYIITLLGTRPEWFLILLLLANVWLIFSLDFYQTLDGPAHFYNSKIIGSLLQNHPEISKWYQLNTGIVPNYTSYGLLMLLSAIFSSSLANKIVILLLTSVPPLLGFSLFKKRFSNGSFWALFLVPMSFTSALQMGFFNFSLGVIALLFYLFFLFKKDLFKPINIVWNFLFTLILLYTHAYVFVMGLFCLVGTVITSSLASPFHWKSLFQSKYLYLFGLSAVPSVVLFVIFNWQHPSFDEQYLDVAVLVEQLVNFTSIVSHHTAEETPFTRVVFFLLLGAVVLKFLSAFGLKNSAFSARDYVFLVVILLLIIFYFTTPDYVGYAGFLSRRHQWYIVFFMLLFLVSFQLPNVVKVAVGIALVFIHVELLQIISKYQQPFQDMSQELFEAAEHVPENAVIYPFHYHSAYEASHASNILGWQKNVIILDNYEANMDYFPVMWRSADMPAIEKRNWCHTSAQFPGYPKTSSAQKVTPIYFAYSNDVERWDTLCPTVFTEAKILYQGNHVLMFQENN